MNFPSADKLKKVVSIWLGFLKPRIFLLFFLFIALWGAVGCGSSSTVESNPQKAASSNNGSVQNHVSSACKLFTKAEMSSAFGQDFNEPTENPVANGTYCTFESIPNKTDLDETEQLVVVVTYYPNGAPSQDPSRQQAIPGLGDDAYYNRFGINVIKGGNWLVIDYPKERSINKFFGSDSWSPGPNSRLEDLARKAAERM